MLAAGAASGWRVVNADRQSGAAVEGVEFRYLDIIDEATVSAVVIDARPDAIIHCAAIGDVDQSERNPDLAWRVNVNGTANVARAAAQAGARLIFISTSTIFDGRSIGASTLSSESLCFFAVDSTPYLMASIMHEASVSTT